MGQFYAHTPVENGPWHDLVSHLERTSALAQENASKFGADELGRLAGLWHDLGKFNPAFQEYLKGCHEADLAGEVPPKSGTPHAVYGAMLAFDSVQVLAAAIHGHHAGLPNKAKLKDVVRQPEQRERYEGLLPVAEEAMGSVGFRGDVRSLFTDPPREVLQAEVFQRMLFSALVDADFLDTETHFEPEASGLRGAEVGLREMWEVFRRDQAAMTAGARCHSTPVNRVRNKVYGYCLEAAETLPGVFRLGVPTGGGKTRSGLAFALRHAVEHDLDRVIVAVPYTSIIEQTAGVYQEIFSELDENAVLEHHSAVRRTPTGDDERQDELGVRARLASQNWDAPLVVTTTVQLFESLFANRTSRCRKLHNIARSVVVLDEVQTLPVGLLAPTVDMLKELVRRYEVSVVLCTATQPALDERSKYLEGFDAVRDIVPEDRAAEHFQTLRRVEYEIPQEEWTWREVAERFAGSSTQRQAMVVVNTRKDALAVLDELAELGHVKDGSVLHLSTLLCGAHRRDVLGEVRRRLEVGEPCLLVATQVVEAGVDLDFPVVFRALGPLDRIVQAAGRCNREGRSERPGRVVVFRPEEGRLPRGEYTAGTEEASIILKRPDLDLHEPAIFREYFRNLYQDVSTDGRGVQKLRKELDYPEVAGRYRLISEQSVPVVVRYGGGGELDRLLERIRKTGLWSGDHRRLQPYVVSMFENEFEDKREWVIEVVEELYVWSGGYDDLRGIEDVDNDPSSLMW